MPRYHLLLAAGQTVSDRPGDWEPVRVGLGGPPQARVMSAHAIRFLTQPSIFGYRTQHVRPPARPPIRTCVNTQGSHHFDQA